MIVLKVIFLNHILVHKYIVTIKVVVPCGTICSSHGNVNLT